MLRRLKEIAVRLGLIKVPQLYVFRGLNNPEFDVRRAFRWDGKESSREALKQFMGHTPVKFYNGDGSVLIAGYNQIELRAGMFIWEDSDGYDIGNEYHVNRNFIVEVDDGN